MRHACAGHLVAEGFSLKEIGDHLGHRSAEATRIYAKVDLVLAARSGRLPSGRPAMKLTALTAQYVSYKQSMGMRFHTEARTLRSFCRAVGDMAIAEVAADRVQATSPAPSGHAFWAPQTRSAPRLLPFCDGTGIRRQFSAPQDRSQATSLCVPYLFAGTS